LSFGVWSRVWGHVERRELKDTKTPKQGAGE
jgi:hypothetical protein